MATGISPLLLAVDARTGIVYVTDFGSAAVTILDGSRCNAEITAGSHPHRLRRRHLPARIHLHPQSHPPLTSGGLRFESVTLRERRPGVNRRTPTALIVCRPGVAGVFP